MEGRRGDESQKGREEARDREESCVCQPISNGYQQLDNESVRQTSECACERACTLRKPARVHT